MAGIYFISIKRKLLFIILSVTSIALGLVFLTNLYLQVGISKSTQKQQSINDARLIAFYCSNTSNNNISINKTAIDSVLKTFPSIERIEIFDKNHLSLYNYSTTKEQSEFPHLYARSTTVQYGESRFFVVEPIFNKGTVLGWIELTYTYQNILKPSVGYVGLTIFILVFIFMIAYISAYFLQRNISRPIYELANFAETIKNSKNLGLRLPLKKAKDEIGILKERFNALLEQIQNHEDERNKAESELRESEKKFRILTELLPQPVFETDINGNITYLNRIGLHLFNFTIDNIKSGLNITQFVDSDIDMLKTAKSQNELPFQFHFFDVKGKSNDGTIFPCIIYFGPILKKDQFQGIRGFIINMSERIKFEEELRQAKIKAEEADRLKSAFLANMSHEIRTPLNSIMGFADLLDDESLSIEERKEFIDSINLSGKALTNLINDIIDIAKIEASQLKITPSIFELHDLLKEIKKTFDEDIKRKKNKDISLDIQYNTSEQLFLKTDSSRLHQILNNLLTNAIKFTDTGSVTVSYCIRKIGEVRHIQFMVKDTGIGISHEHQEKIFDRFTKIENPKQKQYRGNGLGLAITKNLVELLGGNIWVESEEKKGSTFTFHIPFEQVTVINTENKTEDYTPKEIIDWSNKTILIAEDEESNFRFIKAALQKTHVNIVWVQNGDEVLEELKKGTKFDAILMDIKMPGLNGLDTTKIIREIQGNSIPIIAQTAFAMSGEKEKCIEAGCNDYLAKPIKQKDLIQSINKNLHN